jgi:hypothetical protein
LTPNCIGKIALCSDPPDQMAAQRHFPNAIAVAKRQEAPMWQLSPTTRLARLLSDTNLCDDARDAPEIYNCFIEGFDISDLKDAKALLDELSV